jgi:hypothetical protein
MFRQLMVKFYSIEFHRNPSSGYGVVSSCFWRTDGRTDGLGGIISGSAGFSKTKRERDERRKK